MSNYNFSVISEYNSKKREVIYTFTLNNKPDSEVKFQYAFIKTSSAYKIMKNLPDGYQILTFNKNLKKITKTFELISNFNSIDLNLDIRIKESKGKITKINGKEFKSKYDFRTTISKNTNTVIGFESLNNMKKGNYNTALGSQTMINSNGNNIIKSNTAIGGKSLKDVKGGFNTAVGYESGINIIGGSNNILIGAKSKISEPKSEKEVVTGNSGEVVKDSAVELGNSSNEIVIGNNATGVENSVVIGNSNITSIEPGNNNTTLGTKLNKFSTTFISEISNGQVTIKLPNKKLDAGMLMLDANGNLTSGNLKNEIKANSSKGNIIFIEVNKGNINGINNNPNVFYKFTAYAYNELTNKKGDLLKNWNGKLDVSKTYVFGRKENTEEHPFYMSDVGYKKKPNKVSIKNIVGKGMNFNNGITGKQRIELKFNSKFNAHDKLYYYCTKHRKMIGEFELFSSDWYKLIVTPRPGLEPGTNLTIKSIDRDKNGNPLKGNQYIFDKNNKNNKAIGKNIVYELALDRKVPEGKSVILEYKTLDRQGSAVVGKDFKSTQGTVIFTTGTDPNTGFKDGKGKFQEIIVPVLDDAVYEGDKIVKIKFTDINGVLTNTENGLLYSEAKIFDYDTNPINEKYTLTVNNPTVKEGENLVFNLKLDKEALTDVYVQYAVVKNQTTLKFDKYKLPYYEAEYAVFFKKGTSEAKLTIPTLKDGLYDNKEKKLMLQFTSSNFNNNYKVRATGTVTEGDKNPANETYNIKRISEPYKSNDPNTVEGDKLYVEIILDKPVLTDIVVNVITEDGTARAGTHYEALKNKKITFKKGEFGKIFTIQTYSDNKYTGQSKKFKIKITGNNLKGISRFGTIPKLIWTKDCIIKEGDGNPLEKIYNLIGLNAPGVMEGDFFVQNMEFKFKLSEKALRDIVIDYETIDEEDEITINDVDIDTKKDRATAGEDYISKSGSITIKKGKQEGSINIEIIGDTTYDNKGENHIVYVKFSGDYINDRIFRGDIIENDVPNDKYKYRNITSWGSEEYDSDLEEKVKIVPKVTESNTKMKYIVNLGEKARSDVIINYKTVDGTAKAGKDYESKSGKLIFKQGKQESKEFKITINDDSDFEIEEKLYVEFSGPNIDTFKIQGIIKPDNDKDPNKAKPDLTIEGTKYNDDNGELSIKLNNIGDRDVQLNYPQVNSLFEATTNENNKQSGTPEIKIGNKTYYVSKNDITYLDIENQNFDTYFNGSYGKNIKSKKGNTYEIIPSYDIANDNYYSITNNPGLKKNDRIEFKIKASFKKNTTYIFMADDIKYNDVKESNENNNYFVFTPEKTITYNDPNSNDSGNDSGSGSGGNTNNEYPTISGYTMVEKAEFINISKYGSGNNSWIDVYLEHYPPAANYVPAKLQIADVSPGDLKKYWKLVVKDGDEFITFDIKDYNDGMQDISVNKNDYYYYFGVKNVLNSSPEYDVSSPVVDTYWYKKN